MPYFQFFNTNAMRIFCILSGIITIGLILLLNMQLTVGGNKTPRLGFFLSPQKGFWQNAEPTNVVFNEHLSLHGLQGNASVYFDERLVPHVYAASDEDAFFVQGYLHAKFRLWQMDFQTAAAGGRLSEIMGDSASGTNFLATDKFFSEGSEWYMVQNNHCSKWKKTPQQKPIAMLIPQA